MSRSSLFPLSALLLCFAATVAWASPGTVLRDERLYSQPRSSAAVTAHVRRGTPVEIVGKQGGWLRVTSGRTSGWIRLLSVRAGAGSSRSSGAADVFGAATRRSDPSRVVSVAGLRGLNDEDLKLAKFDAEEVARLESLDVTPTQIRNFARQSRLTAVTVAPLPDPRAADPASPWEENP